MKRKPLSAAEKKRREDQSRRRKGHAVLGYKIELTVDEMDLLEEALLTYRLELEGYEKLTPVQEWAKQRAEGLRRRIRGELDGYAYADVGAVREKPIEDVPAEMVVHACPYCRNWQIDYHRDEPPGLIEVFLADHLRECG